VEERGLGAALHAAEQQRQQSWAPVPSSAPEHLPCGAHGGMLVEKHLSRIASLHAGRLFFKEESRRAVAMSFQHLGFADRPAESLTRVLKSKVIQKCSIDIMGRKCFSAGVLKIIVDSCNIHAAPIRGGDFWESAMKDIVESAQAYHGQPEQQPKDPDKEEDPDTEEDASPGLPRPKPRGKASSAPRQGRQDRRQNNRPPPGPPGGDLSLGACADCEKLWREIIQLRKEEHKMRLKSNK